MLQLLGGPREPAPEVLVKALLRPQSLGGSQLVRDYLQGDPSATSFYGGPPFDLDTFRRKLDDRKRRFGPEQRAMAAAALKPTSDDGRARLGRFVEEGGAMVTTGQQAGLLTGPLYTIYKAASAIALAKHLEEMLGVLVLPVFWVASEDHDWAEANHTTLIDRKGRLRRFELQGTDPRPLQMSDRRLEGDLEVLLDEVAQTVGGARSNGDQVAAILAPYRSEGKSVGQAFREALSTIFAGTDLLVADAADPAIKGASTEVLRMALVDSAEHEALLEARSESIQAAGYAPQVNVLERGTNVFYRSEAGRHRLYRRGEDFLVREQRRTFARDELLEELGSNPERFSPNVFLRPVVESAVFPTLAYVGGPGEIAYFAQVTALFEPYDIVPPAVLPRFSAVVVEPAIERLLDDLGLSLEDLELPREVLIERLAQQQIPEAVHDALRSLRENLTADFESLIDRTQFLDPTLAGALGSIRNRELGWAGRAERKIVRSVKRGDQIAVDKLDRVMNALRPQGASQERLLNLLPYVGRYGEHFFRELERAIRDHWRLPGGG